MSPAQWLARIGFKNDWVTQQSDWNKQGAFLARVELADKVELGMLAVRTVNVGEKKLYLIGGRRLDNGCLQALVVPAGMRVLFYRNLEAAFVPGALLDSEGAAEQPERFANLIGSMQKQPRAGEYEVAGSIPTAKAERFMALPLTGRNNELLAAVLLGNAQHAIVRTLTYIRNTALAICAAGVFLSLIFSFSVSRQGGGPLPRLGKAARQQAAPGWDGEAHVPAR